MINVYLLLDRISGVFGRIENHDLGTLGTHILYVPFFHRGCLLIDAVIL